MTENVLWRAAQRVKGHWHQGFKRDGNGNFCGLGHLNQVQLESCDEGVPAYKNDNAAAMMMDKVAAEQYPDRLGIKVGMLTLRPFASFNDHPNTTEDEVISVMEKAAVRLDERV